MPCELQTEPVRIDVRVKKKKTCNKVNPTHLTACVVVIALHGN